MLSRYLADGLSVRYDDRQAPFLLGFADDFCRCCAPASPGYAVRTARVIAVNEVNFWTAASLQLTQAGKFESFSDVLYGGYYLRQPSTQVHSHAKLMGDVRSGLCGAQ
jgi:hypothetical protein